MPKIPCKYLCGAEFQSRHKLHPHLIICPKKKSSEAIILWRRGQAIREADEEGEGGAGERVVIVGDVNGVVEDDGEEVAVGTDESFNRKVAAKIVKRYERDIERKKNRRRPIDLSHN
ncbi:hypothetical protein Tco_0458764 [Tanacetum coccineum]